VHCKKRKGLSVDLGSKAEFDKVVNVCVQKMLPAKWALPEDFLSYAHFQRCVARLEWNSSPGYPYFAHAPNNGQFFGVKEGKPNPDRMADVWSLVQARLVARDADPIRVFVKAEAHTAAKIAAGRYRIISSVSVVDQLIDHMLFDSFNDTIVANNVYIPVKVGWAPYKGGWKTVPPLKVATDNSSHDQSVRLWQCEAALAIREGLCVNLTDQWRDLAAWRYNMLYQSPVMVTSGGLIFRQRNPGIQKSGAVNTLVDNSLVMLAIHAAVSIKLDVPLPHLWLMGDDVLMGRPIGVTLEDYVSELRKHSIVKHVLPEREFAGFKFDGMTVEPIYGEKHCYRLLHMDPADEVDVLASYALLYHRVDYADDFRAMLASTDLPSRTTCDFIWDGEE